ncbi:uncharacterized protein A4U43_C07F31690 [Asparagus officinalis]|uniref:Uncharacterized protein n=1 Tax=Asparagus officinalis TaxID=4686 RepID=A0A5P1EK20_ASPOF|nr:uncharacterized protein A4U43_C07F31690 [Asparagus officinalis]
MVCRILSPLYVLTSCFEEEEAISPAKYARLRDAELKSSHIPLEAKFNYMRDVLDKSGFCGGAEKFLENIMDAS